MRCLLSVVLLLGMAAMAPAADRTVRLAKADGAVEVTVDGRPFAVYRFGDEFAKPFFSPVRGPDGTVLTRPLEDPADHPHHKGIWISVDEVNGVQFWAERGTIRNAAVNLLAAEGNPATMEVVNHWLGADGGPILAETTVVGIHADGLLTFDITLAALDESVTFEDTKEGFLGIRLVDAMREHEGGRVVNADGLQGSRAAWGKPSAWVDYSGEVDGRTYGVAIFDHPENFRASRYHVRDYGLFSVSPFGENAYTNGAEEAEPLDLAPGERVRLRYGMFIHAGDAETADVAGAYEAYLKASR